MHHEILLALSGYPGNTFAVSKETGVFEIVPGLPFIHPSERDLLNKVCRLGTFYMQLREFISEQNTTIFCLVPKLSPQTTDGGRGRGGGLYLKALALGIDNVLNDYRQSLVKLEQKCIQEPHLPLSQLQSELEKYQTLLPSLDGCVKHIQRGQLRGGQILSHVHELCASGVPDIQRAYEKILAVCHGVLYKQLSAWMLHGISQDQDEFFIEPSPSQTEAAATTSNSDGGREEPKDDQRKSVGFSDSCSLFAICHPLVPSYLPMRVIEKILFVGEAVQIFQMQAHGKHDLSTVLTGAGSQLRSDQFRFGRLLTELQRQPVFQLREFESAIDNIRDCVAEHLWRLLVEDSNLVGQLQIIKDFFLLGRGELFLTFVDLAHSFLKLPPAPTTQHDVNVAFQQAMLKVGIENDDLMKQFQLTLPERKGSLTQAAKSGPSGAVRGGGGKGKGAWDLLGMTHTVEWPLHILFTPVILDKYNTVFQFLLLLRRTQIGLQQSWAVLMQHRRRLEELKVLWKLRMHMAFLIDNLLYYVQVDVLESQFSQLLDKVKSTHDFESIKHAHESFVTTLLSQLFLLLPTVSHCLLEITGLCNSFSSVIESRQDLSLTHQDRGKVDQIAKDFKRQASLFFNIVSSVKSHQAAPHLAQLLLRVDYNKYFSTQNLLAGSSVTSSTFAASHQS